MTNLNTKHFTLPPSYYQKVLREYNNWLYAWFREVLQNSIDAKAKEIVFTAKEVSNDVFTAKEASNDVIEITIRDNGVGMDESILENGFMSLGGSIKSGEDSVGGFGVASMMIAQSHINYVVRSQDILCEGATGTYTVSKTSDYFSGCSITVKMRKSDVSSWGPISRMKECVEKWSNFSGVGGVKIIFNDEDVSPKLRKFKYNLKSELGNVSFDEITSSNVGVSSVLHVRIKNQPMFSIGLYNEDISYFEGVLDLNGDSKANLTSNRDMLIREKKDLVVNLLKELSDERSKYKLGKMSGFTLNKLVNHNDMSSIEDKGLMSKSMSLVSDGSPKNYESGDSEVSQIFNGEKAEFKVIKDSIEKGITKISSSSYPFNFNIESNFDKGSKKDTLKSLTSLVKLLNQKKNQKIAWSWKYTVESLIDTLIESDGNYLYKKVNGSYFYYDKMIVIGFVLSDEAEGMCCDKKDLISILINPKISSDFDIWGIQDVAIHELSHIETKHHNEFFSVKTDNLRRLWRKSNKDSDFKRNIKEFIRCKT